MFLLDDSYWRITQTPDRGRGVIAEREISPGALIGDYTGKVIHHTHDDPTHGLYSLQYSDELLIVPPDHTQPGVHLINHACMPNCALYPYKDRMLIVSLRKIFPGEELVYEYLLEPPDDEDDEYPCFCGTPLCRGTMHVSLEVTKRFNVFVEEQQGDLYLNPPGKAGETIEPLDHYPEHVSDNAVFDLVGNLQRDPLVMDTDKLPDAATIRAAIRESGLCLVFPKLGYRVLGFFQQQLILSPTP